MFLTHATFLTTFIAIHCNFLCYICVLVAHMNGHCCELQKHLKMGIFALHHKHETNQSFLHYDVIADQTHSPPLFRVTVSCQPKEIFG